MSTRIGEVLNARELDPADARALLRAVLAVTDARIAAHPEQELTEAEHRRYLDLAGRRRAGEPVAYLTGEREFYSLSFHVTPAVLIPRPETELLVDLALERAGTAQAPGVLDLATGSGCVAVAIAVNRPDARVTATDVAADAIAVARENAARHRARVEFLQSDWFAALPGRRFDLIVANPPYVAADYPHLGDLRFEPLAALVAGPTGYECLDAVVAQAPLYLARGGWLLFEHGYDQARGARSRLAQAGYGKVFSARDLAGMERVSGGQV